MEHDIISSISDILAIIGIPPMIGFYVIRYIRGKGWIKRKTSNFIHIEKKVICACIMMICITLPMTFIGSMLTTIGVIMYFNIGDLLVVEYNITYQDVGEYILKSVIMLVGGCVFFRFAYKELHILLSKGPPRKDY